MVTLVVDQDSGPRSGANSGQAADRGSALPAARSGANRTRPDNPRTRRNPRSARDLGELRIHGPHLGPQKGAKPQVTRPHGVRTRC